MNIEIAVCCLLAFDVASAILCWTCTNARSEKECRNRGRPVLCQGEGKSCQIEVRYEHGWGVATKITKRCKQSLACENNYNQNVKTDAIQRQSQCSPNVPSPVCRCCCETDKCNYDALACWNEPQFCPEIEDLENGKVSCTDGYRGGSRCDFKCNSGFTLEGSPLAHCLPSFKWDSPAPSCQPVTCRGLPATVLYGSLECSGADRYLSKCTITCEPGYELSGPSTSVCTARGVWTAMPSMCHSDFCKTEPRRLENGAVVCTNNKQKGSVCGFACDIGYRLEGQGIVTCNSSLQWDYPTPFCTPVVCPSLPVSTESAPSAKCTFGNKYPSTCRFSCSSGLKLKGSDTSHCTRLGEWSRTIPACQPLVCVLPKTPLPHGTVQCSASQRKGSSCSFKCQPGFTLRGSATLQCNDSLQWNKPLPRCVRTTCTPPPPAIPYGSIKCTLENRVSSTCRFYCDFGYILMGQNSATCLDNGKWSEPLPKCKKSAPVCNYEYSSIPYGSVKCSSNNYVGSVCDFQCKAGYKLHGYKQLTCLSSLKWDYDTPACNPPGCPPVNEILKYGTAKCTDFNRYSSLCSVRCKPGYYLEGRDEIVCGEYSSWTPSIPFCKGVRCKAQERMPHGNVKCSQGRNVGSTCEFKCTAQNYTLHPPGLTSNVCMDDNEWSRPTPCCAPLCPPNSRMDLILLLDASSSIGEQNWSKMINFLQDFMDDFVVSFDSTNFGVVRYNSQIDTASQILLKDHPNDLGKVLNKVGNLAYNGSETFTGKALRYARDVMFKKENGNREEMKDVLLVITDGKSQDSVGMPARKLRKAGVQTYVLPVKPARGNLNLGHLRQIAGRRENIITAAAELGFRALTAKVSEHLGKIVCGNPCDHAAPETPLDRLVALSAT